MSYEFEDGRKLIAGTYRQSVSLLPKKKLQKIINAGISEFGDYVLVTERGGIGYTINYSKEPGISLGDYVISRLNNEIQYAIFIEEIANYERPLFACLIIAEGEIAAEFFIYEGDINEDLVLTLEAYKDVKFDIYSVDQEDLIKATQGERPRVFAIGVDMIGDTHIINPIIKGASADQISKYAFVGAGKALKNKFHNDNEKTGDIGTKLKLFLIGFLVFGYTGYSFKDKIISHKEINEKPQQDPYEQYRNVTKGLSSPIDDIKNAFKLIHAAENSLGWNFVEAQITNAGIQDSYSIKFSNDGGNITGFIPIRNELGVFKTKLDGNKFIIEGFAPARNRNFPYIIYRFDELEYYFFQASSVDNSGQLSMVADKDYGKYVTRQYTVSFKEASLLDVLKFASSIQNMPIVINSIKVQPLNGSYDFDFSITLFGKRV